MEYSNQFYATYQCADLMNELEKCRVEPGYKLDVQAHYQQIVGYLEWLENLSSLINTGVLHISKIDNVMSCRYFLIVNNKQVQEGELLRNREFYRSIYDVYPDWVAYKKKYNPEVVGSSPASATIKTTAFAVVFLCFYNFLLRNEIYQNSFDTNFDTKAVLKWVLL